MPGSASDQFIAALADVFGLDDAAPKYAWRVRGTQNASVSRSMLGV